MTEPQDPPETDPLADMVTHDLRGPAHAVLGFSSVLMSGKAGPLNPLQREFLESIFVAGRRLERLINDLEVILSQKSPLSIIPEEVDLRRHIEMCVREVSLMMGEIDYEIGITVKHPTYGTDDLVMVHADPMRLEQILLNILQNAVQYGEHGSSVTIDLRASSSRILVMVTNVAVGLDSEDTTNWLIPFKRGESAQGATASGSGLGLAVANLLVGLHGGNLFLRQRDNLVTVGFCLPRRHSSNDAEDTCA